MFVTRSIRKIKLHILTTYFKKKSPKIACYKQLASLLFCAKSDSERCKTLARHRAKARAIISDVNLHVLNIFKIDLLEFFRFAIDTDRLTFIDCITRVPSRRFFSRDAKM